jgi:hypothetical protein
MKKLIVALLLILSSGYSYSQLGLKILNFRPYGDLGAILKSGFTGEIMYLKNADDDPFRARFGFSFISLKPRLDTFPLVAETNASGYASVIPGWEVINHQTIGFVFCGYDYVLLDPEKFFIYPGADLLAGFTSVKVHTFYPGISDSEESTGGVLGGIRLRIGAQVMLNGEWGIFAEASHSMYIMSQDETTHAHNDFGIGIQYLIP